MFSKSPLDFKDPAGLSALLLAVVLVAATVFVTGCGLKGDPLPPLSTVPAKTQDLKLRQEGGSILFEMAYPATTRGGLTLGGIDAVELLQVVRSAAPEGEPPTLDAREFNAAAATLLTLRGAELNAAVTGDRIEFRLPLAEELPAEPTTNIFGVRTVKGSEVSDVSNLAALVPLAPPPAPADIAVAARTDGIELSWTLDTAAEAEGFDVFRRKASDRGYGKPIQRVTGDQRKFLDRGARYGERYIYTVRTVAGSEPLIRSAEAGEREVEYLDRFAPSLPRNFVALAERASVRLRWDASAADDVAGYILHRREPGRDFHRITRSPVTQLEYLDRGLTTGFSYSYRIQVVDREGNESGLSEPVTTTAR